MPKQRARTRTHTYGCSDNNKNKLSVHLLGLFSFNHTPFFPPTLRASGKAPGSRSVPFPAQTIADNKVDEARSPWAAWRSAALQLSRWKCAGPGGQAGIGIGHPPHPGGHRRIPARCAGTALPGQRTGQNSRASEPGASARAAVPGPGLALNSPQGPAGERKKKKSKKKRKKWGALFFRTHVRTHPRRSTYLYPILSSSPALILFSLPLPAFICSWTTLRAFQTHVVLTPQHFD